MEEKLKKEWQEYVDSQVWQGEDEFTKNMGVGNVADWWIDKFSSRQISLIKMIVEMVESEKGKKHPNELFFFSDCPQCGQEVNQTFVTAKITEVADQALDTISSKLKILTDGK